jgi:catechol 2,3-dioxygenase-like lactoylglutathione lyase family enzyme
MPLPTSSRPITFIGTQDMAQAKAFYAGCLGLTLVSEDGFALVFDCFGIMLRVTAVPKTAPAGYTVLGWEVDDIEQAVHGLVQSGVTLEHYPGMGLDESGIWTAPQNVARVAWFKDPDGNVLSVSQHSSL